MYSILLIAMKYLVAWLSIFYIPTACIEQEMPVALMVQYKDLDSPEDILPVSDSLVKPVIYNNGVSLAYLDQDEKKQKFIDLILPSILITKYQIDQDRIKIGLLQDLAQQQGFLEPEDSLFLEEKLKYFHASDLEELKFKMQTHPVSIVLAQAAIESGWGTSRFFTEANNIFGIWSFSANDDRVRARYGRNGKAVYVKDYADMTASINDYFRTLSRSSAYKTFREKRIETNNSFELIRYLNRYSELGFEYVKKLEVVMRKNDFTRYDNYQLDPVFLVPVENLGDDYIVAMAE
jgi:Bax protein